MSSKRCFQIFLVTSSAGMRCFLQQLGMHAHHQHLLVVGAVEDADVAALRQAARAAPQIIVVEFLGRRRFEGEHLAALRIHAGHDVLDGAVLAGGIHGLEDQQQRPAVLGIEFVLQLGQLLRLLLLQVLRFGLEVRIKAAGVAG